MSIHKFLYASPLGPLTLTSDNDHLLSLSFGQDTDASSDLPNVPPLKLTLQWLDSYFCGMPTPLPDVPINPKGTAFQKICWQELLQVPYGKTITYLELARRVATQMGTKKMSCQAVGQAIGKNPIGILIPCHRVIGSNGSLTGYAWGLENKEKLLAHETQKVL